MKLSMKYHRSRLFFIKNQILILYCVVLFGWTFSIILGVLVVGRMQEIGRQLRDGQKGNTCILLIQPENRTKKNVSDCIDNNRTPGNNSDHFNFNESNPPPRTSHTKQADNSIQVVSIPPNRPILLPIESRTASTPAPTPPPSPEPAKPKPVKRVTREVETRVNSLGQVECRLVGDTFWILGNCK